MNKIEELIEATKNKLRAERNMGASFKFKKDEYNEYPTGYLRFEYDKNTEEVIIIINCGRNTMHLRIDDWNLIRKAVDKIITGD